MVNGQVGLENNGGQTVYGVVLVEFADGTEHASLFGCLSIRDPTSSDPLCPTGSATTSP